MDVIPQILGQSCLSSLERPQTADKNLQVEHIRRKLSTKILDIGPTSTIRIYFFSNKNFTGSNNSYIQNATGENDGT
jgi:hypothetical protein